MNWLETTIPSFQAPHKQKINECPLILHGRRGKGAVLTVSLLQLEPTDSSGIALIILERIHCFDGHLGKENLSMSIPKLWRNHAEAICMRRVPRDRVPKGGLSLKKVRTRLSR